MNCRLPNGYRQMAVLDALRDPPDEWHVSRDIDEAADTGCVRHTGEALRALEAMGLAEADRPPGRSRAIGVRWRITPAGLAWPARKPLPIRAAQDLLLRVLRAPGSPRSVLRAENETLEKYVADGMLARRTVAGAQNRPTWVYDLTDLSRPFAEALAAQIRREAA